MTVFAVLAGIVGLVYAVLCVRANARIRDLEAGLVAARLQLKAERERYAEVERASIDRAHDLAAARAAVETAEEAVKAFEWYRQRCWAAESALQKMHLMLTLGEPSPGSEAPTLTLPRQGAEEGIPDAVVLELGTNDVKFGGAAAGGLAHQ